jgi:ornithine cyclodeaminase
VRVITAADLEARLDPLALVEKLRSAFRGGVHLPPRQHYDVPSLTGSQNTLLIMPAWQIDRHVGIKIVTVAPDNTNRCLPTILGTYLLLDAKTGAPIALVDGPALTARRTAAASALAASYLARPDADRLLMVGTGTLAPFLIAAHGAVSPIRQVLIWGRDSRKAEKLAKMLPNTLADHRWAAIRKPTFAATADLTGACAGASIISAATLSVEPLIRGEWLTPGTHVDLVGAFKPSMRESDAEVMQRGRVFVDTRAGALSEAGDIVQAIDTGHLHQDDIAADLFELCRGEKAGRRFHKQITVFKSVGTALEDLAAAQLALCYI